MNTFRVLKKSTFQNITGMAIINKWVENYIMSITDLAQVWNSKAHPQSFLGSILYCHKGVGVLLALAREARYGHVEEFKNAQTHNVKGFPQYQVT